MRYTVTHLPLTHTIIHNNVQTSINKTRLTIMVNEQIKHASLHV